MDAFATEQVFTTGIVAFSVVATVFAIVLLVNIVLKNKAKWEKPKECSTCKRSNRLHMYYIAGIFLFLLILAFTYIMVNGNHYAKVNEYFTFTATIVSIVLAILTIVYSYFINASSTGQVDKLNKTSDEISAVSSDISKASSSIDDNTTKLAENIDKILNKLDTVEKNTKNLNEFFNKPIDTSAKNGNSKIDTNSTPKQFIYNTPWVGIIGLLACKYAYKKKIEFKLLDITTDKENDIYYLWGFLVATQAIGYVKLEVANADINATSSIKVTYLEPDHQNNIETAIKRGIKTITDEELKEYVTSCLSKIKAYFGVTDDEETSPAQ